MSFKALELNGKTAVVIGGTSGIGRAVAHGLAQAGADVVCSSRRIEQVEAVALEIENLKRKTLRVTTHVARRRAEPKERRRSILPKKTGTIFSRRT